MSCWDYIYAWLLGHFTVSRLKKSYMFQQTAKPDCSIHQHLPEVQHPDPLTVKKDGCEPEQLFDQDCTHLALRKSLYCVVPPWHCR